jgi:hypothetical protein
MLSIWHILLGASYALVSVHGVRVSNRHFRAATRVSTRLDAGSLDQVEALSAAFIGGTVGIMGTMMALEVKTKQDGGLDCCPYCMGHGEILCGRCLGSGSLSGSGACPECGCTGAVMCLNCKGDGRLTPLMLQNKVTQEPDSAYQSKLSRTSTIDNP